MRRFRITDVARLLRVGHLCGKGSEYLLKHAYTVVAWRLLMFVCLAALANVVCFENFMPFWATY